MNTSNVNVYFRRTLSQANQNQITGDGTALTGSTPDAGGGDGAGGRLVPAPDR